MSISSRFSEVDRLYGNAVKLISEGNIPAAADLLASITEKFPDHAKAWTRLGDIFKNELEDLVSAEECYKKAMESEPSYAPAFLSYADVLFSKQHYAEVNAIINKAMEMPGVAKDVALYKSGMLKESQARFDDAIETYRNAILSSFSEDEIIKCEKAIRRCEMKKKYS